MAGSSAYFKGGFVSYTAEMKVALGVDAEIVARHGVVSAEVAQDMARACRQRLGADIGVGITGVAGPDPLEGKPPGTVHIGLDDGAAPQSRELRLHSGPGGGQAAGRDHGAGAAAAGAADKGVAMKRIVVALALTLIAGVLAAPATAVMVADHPRLRPPQPRVVPRRTATPRATVTTTAPTASATPAATVSSGGEQLAYSDGEDIWLINADGSGQRKLTEGQCAQAAGPFWSRRGDKIACVSGGTEEAPLAKIAVFDLEGQTLAQPEHEAWLGSFAWSADDRHFVYSIAEGETLATSRVSLIIGDAESTATVRLEDAQDARWSPDGAQLAYLKSAGQELTIYDLASGQDKPLRTGLQPLAWALGGKALLVAANYQAQEVGATYEANLLDLASGEMTRGAGAGQRRPVLALAGRSDCRLPGRPGRASRGR